ncbi:ADP-ribosylglycohydrolase family protein [Bifidobacterium sp. ESL0764]|uniref:ADP-ribosylglycohydrolase family protein n=1 Tax=Bifidobacterium sp. ESL0764 TaxID=2983228 RepID=UPI0023F906B1|nr:ADP-ribosylglycohydrolase family protein [Bifidobacterium sp. ESL0764]WEV66051.1 ADP-ribosylglycohydrolase family protein [Bifidobacterium sp. ESL0764]
MEVGSDIWQDHALGALRGLSLGDAIGMPTQSMSHEWIGAAYGKVTGLVDAIADQPIAPGMAAGSVTDDTEQALLVAGLIAEGCGHIDSARLASKLLAWEDDMKRRGSLDLLGPSTKLALEQVRNGADISKTGRTGTTNGAAMRVAPVGIAHDAGRPSFAGYVYESCRVTHNTVPGFQSALLVAAAVSFGVSGETPRISLDLALRLAENASYEKAAWSPKASVVARAKSAIKAAQSIGGDDEFVERLRLEFGTSVEADESVAVAFALAYRYADQPLKALLTAANIGGDTDTIGAICGAMLGAALGADAFPETLTGQVAAVSHLELAKSVKPLLRIRAHEAKETKQSVGRVAPGGPGTQRDTSETEPGRPGTQRNTSETEPGGPGTQRNTLQTDQKEVEHA